MCKQISLFEKVFEYKFLQNRIFKSALQTTVLIQKYESKNMAPSSAKLHSNKPIAMRLAFIPKDTYLYERKKKFLKRAIKH